jgi:hypothetical protein
MRNSEERFGAELSVQSQDLEVAVQTTNGLNFIVPTEFVALPSKGMFYSEKHPLYRKDSIEVKQMTAKEEDILTSRNLLKKGVALDKLIQSLIVDKSINSDSLTMDDRNAILVNARISAYGAEYATQVVCPNCSEKQKYNFNLLEKVEEIEQKETEEVKTDSFGHFFIELPSTKWTVKCRVLNGADEKALLRAAESKKKSSAGDSLLLEQLNLTVVSIQNVEDRTLIHKALDAMPAKDSRYLREQYQKLVASVDMTQHFACNSCDYEASMEVPLSADFFWFK